MLRDILRPKPGKLFNDIENVWLQQFGATVQTSSQSLTFVKEMFPGHVIIL